MTVAPIDRFMAKVRVDEATGCWLWTAGVSDTGYGSFRDGKTHSAHRWLYEHLVGPVPRGLQLDHLCRVRRCVNPDHLDPVTRRENILRGTSVSADAARAAACPAGHEYTTENTYTHIYRGRARRDCRACHRVRERRRRATKGTT